ncbi:MAG: hypothetical protein P8M06_04465 [Pelagibacterales bacterium]|nr:hypothetical protein [Pelagibacterales bacterium]
MRKYFFIFLFFLISNLANALNYYEDALSKYDLKDFKSSIQLLEKSIVFNPKDSESWILLGKSYVSIENKEVALKYLETAFTLKPESPELNLLLGELSHDLNLNEKYQTYLENLEIICPSGCSELSQLKKIKID